jgi:hypothetical protein
MRDVTLLMGPVHGLRPRCPTASCGTSSTSRSTMREPPPILIAVPVTGESAAWWNT